MDREDSLRVSEIFYSLQGEARHAGAPTVFVRLTGCPLRCGYCDTAYAFTGGERRTREDILAAVSAYAPRAVCVTGGEPLAQSGVHPLLGDLCDAGYAVSLETSGALSVRDVDSRVEIVMDLKTPGSGECLRNESANLEWLKASDQIKFVITDRADYDWSRAEVAKHDLARRFTVWFSPAWGELAPGLLADWILADRVPVRLQVQLHKILWGDVRGR